MPQAFLSVHINIFCGVSKSHIFIIGSLESPSETKNQLGKGNNQSFVAISTVPNCIYYWLSAGIGQKYMTGESGKERMLGDKAEVSGIDPMINVSNPVIVEYQSFCFTSVVWDEPHKMICFEDCRNNQN